MKVERHKGGHYSKKYGICYYKGFTEKALLIHLGDQTIRIVL